MEHAEAHELLADLALEPSRLARLETDGDPTTVALRDHVSGCARCSARLADARTTWAAVGAARASGRGVERPAEADLSLIRPPDRLRRKTMAAIRAGAASAPMAEATRSARAAPRTSKVVSIATALRSTGGHWRGLLAAAAVIVAVVAGTVAVQSQLAREQADSDLAALSSTTATLDRILASPHKVVTLHAADGSAGGVLAWSKSEFLVLTSSLQAPGPNQVYRCWVDANGSRTVIGSLYFAGSAGSWSGSMSAWQWGFAPGTQFGVSLYGRNGNSAEPVLVATF